MENVFKILKVIMRAIVISLIIGIIMMGLMKLSIFAVERLKEYLSQTKTVVTDTEEQMETEKETEKITEKETEQKNTEYETDPIIIIVPEEETEKETEKETFEIYCTEEGIFYMY